MSKTYIPKALRERVARQSLYRCGYCLTQEMIVGATMEIDHLIPEALGGRTEEDNLWLACSSCNDHKGNKVAGLDLTTGLVASIFDPRRQRWRGHFDWSPEGDQIIGRTATGRVTILILNLNRPELVRARQLWVQAGWHPPADTA